MRLERWSEIERIFHLVLSGGLEQRTALLISSCGDDDELRREVELLLDAQENAGSFLDSRKLPAGIREMPEEPHPVMVGRTIGQYQILSQIGAGAMGEIYLARDMRLGRLVAVKLLPTRFTSDRERVSRFVREAKASSALNHPNIVTVYDGGEDNGVWFIATEFIEGVTLRSKIAEGKLEFSEALDIAIQCAVALDAAHSAGVLHRDIKPENIMIRPDGLVKVVDFGLARISNSAFEMGLLDSSSGYSATTATQAGRILGTPRYMAPEQSRGESTDAGADIFSLGAVLYEMAVGRPSFPGSTTTDVFDQLLASTPPAPSSINKGLPAEFDSIAARALAKRRADRYPTMREFAAALRGVKQRLELRKLSRGNRGLLPAAAFIALVALVVAGTMLWRWRSPGRPQEDIPLTVVPLTTFKGLKDFPALSPDGSKVAFSWNGGRGGVGGKPERNIYVKPVGAGDPLPLTSGDNNDYWPAWSADGNYIAFCRMLREPDNAVYIVPAKGGPERLSAAHGGSGVSWLPDGKTLALARRPGVESAGIYLLNLETGQQRDLTNPAPYYDSRPVVSPDGRWVAFTRGANEIHRRIFIAAVGDGQTRAITSSEHWIIGMTWTPGSRELVYAIQFYGPGNGLWRVPITGGEPRRLVTPDDAMNPSIPLSGGKLAFTQAFIDTNIYKCVAAGVDDEGTPRRFSPASPLITSTREDHSPNFSPDGKWIAFVSRRSGGLEVWTARADGTQATQLTFMRSPNLGTPRWSPDGRWIAFDAQKDGSTDVFVTSPNGGPVRRITTGSGQRYLPSWSADGKWLYYTSNQSGDVQLWKIPFEGGPTVQITRGGGRESMPSLDGKLVYFTKTRPESSIWFVPVEGGTEQPVPELTSYKRISRSWGVAREGIYFISREFIPRQTVRFFSFATKRVSVLATLDNEPIWAVPALSLSPDRRTLLTVNVDHEADDLVLAENFR